MKKNVKGVRVSVQRFSFNTDVYALVLARRDMVLGIQWPVTLGSILWNSSELAMEFIHSNRAVILQGLTTLKMVEEEECPIVTREDIKME